MTEAPTSETPEEYLAPSTDTVPQSNTKSQDALKMAAPINDDTNTETLKHRKRS